MRFHHWSQKLSIHGSLRLCENLRWNYLELLGQLLLLRCQRLWNCDWRFCCFVSFHGRFALSLLRWEHLVEGGRSIPRFFRVFCWLISFIYVRLWRQNSRRMLVKIDHNIFFVGFFCGDSFRNSRSNNSEISQISIERRCRFFWLGRCSSWWFQTVHKCFVVLLVMLNSSLQIWICLLIYYGRRRVILFLHSSVLNVAHELLILGWHISVPLNLKFIIKFKLVWIRSGWADWGRVLAEDLGWIYTLSNHLLLLEDCVRSLRPFALKTDLLGLLRSFWGLLSLVVRARSWASIRIVFTDLLELPNYAVINWTQNSRISSNYRIILVVFATSFLEIRRKGGPQSCRQVRSNARILLYSRSEKSLLGCWQRFSLLHFPSRTFTSFDPSCRLLLIILHLGVIYTLLSSLTSSLFSSFA